MNSQYFILIGLIFNFVGTLFLVFAFIFKQGKEKRAGVIEETITMGPRKNYPLIGIIFLAIGFILQFIGVLLK